MSTVAFATHPGLANDGIVHGFFGREGGVSTGLYASLNCGPGSHDAAENVQENRRRATQAMGMDAERLCSLYQVHSPDVVVVERPFGDHRPKTDAMVTRVRGLTLGILTADCAPVLFADMQAGVIGAAHAGWKGAFTGVVENTVAAMESLGAARGRIVAAVGPCIAQASYEVGGEFVARLVEADAANRQFFIPATRLGHSLFNLPGYVLSRLNGAGLREATWLGMDTLPDDARFFSYRRTTLAGATDYGRQLSAIGLKE